MTTHGDTPSDTASDATPTLEFEDTLVVPGTKAGVWSVISNPEVLARCLPGAEEVERVSKCKYTCEITRGISHLTLTLAGEVDLVELNEPDWVLATGSAHDPKTHSDFELLAAMEMTALDDERVQLAYTAEVSYTGGVASLPKTMLTKVFSADIETYFQNLTAAIEDQELTE